MAISEDEAQYKLFVKSSHNMAICAPSKVFVVESPSTKYNRSVESTEIARKPLHLAGSRWVLEIFSE